MTRGHSRFALLAALLILLSACAEQEARDDPPAEVYRAFFDMLDAGRTQDALEHLAPEGALGDTFRGGSYYMLATEFENRVERNGRIDEIIIEHEDTIAEDEVLIDGRVVFDDGSELPLAIRFSREDDRWVGHL